MSSKLAAVAVMVLCCAAGALAASPFHRLPSGQTTKTTPAPKATPFPFQVCSGAPTDLSVTDIYVTPNPPVKGSNIGLQLLGTVDEQLTEGSNFVINVLYLGTQIFTETVPLENAGATFPVGPGSLQLNYSVLIPSIAPSGAYTIQLTFNDQTGTEITCIALSFSL